MGRGRELEADLFAALAPLADHPLVSEVRGGTGTLAAVELDAELLADNPKAPQELFLATRERGVIVRPLGTSLAVSPPLTATPEHFELVGETLTAALDEAQRRRQTRPPAVARSG